MVPSLKVSSKSTPHSVAGALAGILRERDRCDMQVIGAGALNQGIKAIVIARTFLVEDDLDLACVPEFAEVDIDGEVRTAIRLCVERIQLDDGLVDFDLTGTAAVRSEPAVIPVELLDGHADTCHRDSVAETRRVVRVDRLGVYGP